MLTLWAAKVLEPQRIRVNSVHPSGTMTPLTLEGMADYVAHGLCDDAMRLDGFQIPEHALAEAAMYPGSVPWEAFFPLIN